MGKLTIVVFFSTKKLFLVNRCKEQCGGWLPYTHTIVLTVWLPWHREWDMEVVLSTHNAWRMIHCVSYAPRGFKGQLLLIDTALLKSTFSLEPLNLLRRSNKGICGIMFRSSSSCGWSVCLGDEYRLSVHVELFNFLVFAWITSKSAKIKTTTSLCWGYITTTSLCWGYITTTSLCWGYIHVQTQCYHMKVMMHRQTTVASVNYGLLFYPEGGGGLSTSFVINGLVYVIKQELIV